MSAARRQQRPERNNQRPLGTQDPLMRTGVRLDPTIADFLATRLTQAIPIPQHDQRKQPAGDQAENREAFFDRPLHPF